MGWIRSSLRGSAAIWGRGQATGNRRRPDGWIPLGTSRFGCPGRVLQDGRLRVTPDDERAEKLRLEEREAHELILVLNWLEELKGRVPDRPLQSSSMIGSLPPLLWDSEGTTVWKMGMSRLPGFGFM